MHQTKESLWRRKLKRKLNNVRVEAEVSSACRSPLAMLPKSSLAPRSTSTHGANLIRDDKRLQYRMRRLNAFYVNANIWKQFSALRRTSCDWTTRSEPYRHVDWSSRLPRLRLACRCGNVKKSFSTLPQLLKMTLCPGFPRLLKIPQRAADVCWCRSSQIEKLRTFYGANMKWSSADATSRRSAKR